jgi:hypothetical protein
VRGEIAVEDLRVGDLAVTSERKQRPIVWIGSRTISMPAREQCPVRVRAGALGEGVPARDLWLSPGHAVCLNVIEDVFVPVGELVNGATIVREPVEDVTYWHAELESHDVLLANGAPTESYMDAGNRSWFSGKDGPIDPERVAASLEAYVRPFVDDDASLEAIRRRLASRARKLGWTRSEDMDLHLLVDGRRVEPLIEGEMASFIFASGSTDVTLRSSTFQPAWTGESPDRRELGLYIKCVRLTDGEGVSGDIPFDDLHGFHPEEGQAGEPWRWTAGRLEVPGQVWKGRPGPLLLTVAFNPEAGWAWNQPPATAAGNVVPLSRIA